MADRIMVAGAGKSGIAAAKMLLQLGGDVLLYDSNVNINVEKIKDSFPETRQLLIKTGELKKNDLNTVTLCIISPGIDLEAPFVKVLDQAQIPIWSEIQLAFQKDKGQLVAITGTNGKTTTTALTGAIMEKKYPGTFVVGNIGVPYTETCLQTNETSVTVLETSSFQLETISDFRPHVSAILNITPDHLNRHHTMEKYIAIKESITMNQTEKDFCVLNYDDPVLREFGQSDALKAKTVFFSSRHILEEGYYLKEGNICRKFKGVSEEVIMPTGDLTIIGQHNYENAMAAIAMGFCMDVPKEQICAACREFTAVEHRIEFVRERTGVKYYNDSKGTNPDASIKAVQAMPGPILLIGGGYDKHSTYDEWIDEFDGRVKYLVLIGETRDAIAECCRKHGFDNVMYAESLEEAVKVCASYAEMGDCVLLSPACASWDMFKNYEERGTLFKKYVNEL
ncbi:MAG: UDP-N-acetylmuramoyl-L-alanine--D-glutamate ligase [Lachnospiraceae bacterium]|nr:UDP-N-acetylmuramoyl-L-alanine--D-glutamate ligase [Candidatus Darwinimomas equi]